MSKPVRLDRAIVLDLEMTCWEGEVPAGERPEIIEIGIVEVNLRTLSLRREGRYLVRPIASRVSPYCTALTGLTWEEVRTGRPLTEVCRTLAKEFGGARTTWFAWGRDDEVLARQAATDGAVLPFSGPFLDLSLLHGMAFPDQHRTGLAAACAHYGLDWQGRSHSALDDARMTARVLMEMLGRQRAAGARETA